MMDNIVETAYKDCNYIYDLLAKYGDSDGGSCLMSSGELDFDLSEAITNNKELMSNEDDLFELRGLFDSAAYTTMQIALAFDYILRDLPTYQQMYADHQKQLQENNN